MSEERSFKLSVDFAEIVKQLAETLYPRREDALLELVKNADDAIVLRRMREAAFAPERARITINAERDANELSVRDNGAGISADEFEVFLSQLRPSRQYVAGLDRQDVMKRQWASGFLGLFLLAERVEFSSLSLAAGSPSLRVSVDAEGTATIGSGPPVEEPGTEVRLRLRGDCAYLLGRLALEEFVRTQCRYVKSPIYLDRDADPVHHGAPLRASGGAVDEEDLLARVDNALRSAHLRFDREPAIGGLKPDFVVYGPDQRAIIVEAKSWSTETGNIHRALDQIERYKNATGLDSALIVLAAADPSTSPGVVAVDGLLDAIEKEFRKPAASVRKSKPVAAPRKTVFAAMPFSSEYDDVFFVAMAYAAEKNGAACVRIDKEQFSGEVVDKIRSLIRESAAVICDLSEARPNVLYEAGFAHALEKPTIHICSTPLAGLPFDVRNWNTLEYAHGRTIHLREGLTVRLRAVLT